MTAHAHAHGCPVLIPEPQGPIVYNRSDWSGRKAELTWERLGPCRAVLDLHGTGETLYLIQLDPTGAFGPDSLVDLVGYGLHVHRLGEDGTPEDTRCASAMTYDHAATLWQASDDWQEGISREDPHPVVAVAQLLHALGA